jgi:decaprenylphospho-beta-D-ribofuranose 2-oxidase
MRRYVSLDRRERAMVRCVRPDRYRALSSLPTDCKLLAHGSVLSFAGIGFSEQALAVDMRAFNRILAFAPEGPTITVEAGATLGGLMEFLLPRQLSVPVLPGFPHLTVGGCIAGNVHGKSQFREGCFCDIVEEVTLFHPLNGEVTLNREERPDLFFLTCGGFGLTGIIVSARLRLQRITGQVMAMERVPVASIREGIDHIAWRSDNIDLAYVWHDFSRPGRGTPGFAVIGTIKPGSRAPQPAAFGACRLRPQQRRFRARIINRATLGAVNLAYKAKSLWLDSEECTFVEASFPFLGMESYFSLFGDRGIVEHQILVPYESLETYVAEMIACFVRHDVAPVFFATKLFRGASRLLWYSGEGASFSMLFLNDDRTIAMLDELDVIDAAHGVITNLIKDSRIGAEAVRREYPEYDHFRRSLRQWDPQRMLVSNLSRRLEL